MKGGDTTVRQPGEPPRRGRRGVLFAVIVILVVSLVSFGGLPPTRIGFQSPMPVHLRQLSVQTMVCVCRNLAAGGIIYEWSFSITNEGMIPIIAIIASLDASRAVFVGENGPAPASQTYTLSQFLIEQDLGPPATSFVRNPPLPYVGPTVPLLTDQTASNGEILFQPPPYLLAGKTLPVAIGVTYSNGTSSNVVVSARVVAAP